MKNIIKENVVDKEDDIDEAYEKECLVYLIKQLCRYLTFLSSLDIEERLERTFLRSLEEILSVRQTTGCYFSCCGDDDIIQTLIIIAEKDNVFGEKGLKLLYRLEEKYSDLAVINYDKEKGFSKTQRWLDFVVFVNTVNLFFKDILKQYEDVIKN